MVKSGAVPFHLCPPRTRLVNTARGRQIGRWPSSRDRPPKYLPAHPSASVDVCIASNHLKSSTSLLSTSTGARCMKPGWASSLSTASCHLRAATDSWIGSYASIAVLLVEHYDSFKGCHGCDEVCVHGKSGCAIQVAQCKLRRVSRLFAG